MPTVAILTRFHGCRLALTTTAIASLTLLACGDNYSTDNQTDDNDDDVVVTIDANGRPDAGPGTPDAGPGTPDAMPPEGTVQCEVTVPVPSSGTCSATAGSGTAVVLRGNILGDGATYLDGEVVYDGSKISCVGCDCSGAPGRATATVVDCGGAAISPGLINAHDHLNYNDRSPMASTAAGGTRFNHRHDWRGNVPAPSNQYGTGATSNGMRWGELRQILTGTTSMAASTKANGMVRNLDELEGPDVALGFDATTYEVFALGDSNETFRPNCTWNYKYTEFQVAQMHDLVTHTAEGISDYAQAEFSCQSRSVGGARDFTEKNVAHIHAVGLHTVDYFNMVRDNAKLIWSPRSNISLYGMTAAAETFDRLGGVVALGTDWTYSGSSTVTREMACAQQLSETAYNNYFSDEDVWRMATKNAAIATGADELIGTLTSGKIADIAVFHAAPGQLHGAVIGATTEDTALVIKAGKVMTGEPAVVTALGETCDPITVCGSSRVICTSREFGGATFAQIAAAVPAAYPAVFCADVGAPPNEPTCIPSRPGVYTGPTAMDTDGDGIPNATDKCPNVFDPIRPIDGGQQADNDSDGIGDACDPTPLLMDIDGDGEANETDNCPFLANPTQADADMDGKGDACDGCPNTPNPTSVCGPSAATIPAVRTGMISVGTPVTIANVIVTAVRSNGFMAQDPTVVGGQNAGIFVFTGSAPGVMVGSKVAFSGVVDLYFDQSEINNATVTSVVAGTAITPISLTAAVAATEPYEGVLVTISNVTTVDNPYNCMADAATCMDTGLWEINDTIIAWNNFYSDANWTAESAAAGPGTSVTGVMFYRFDRRRICPRTGADITP